VPHILKNYQNIRYVYAIYIIFYIIYIIYDTALFAAAGIATISFGRPDGKKMRGSFSGLYRPVTHEYSCVTGRLEIENFVYLTTYMLQQKLLI
jgi:hypothetical protein